MGGFTRLGSDLAIGVWKPHYRKSWALVVNDTRPGQSVLWTLAYFRSEQAAKEFQAVMQAVMGLTGGTA